MAETAYSLSIAPELETFRTEIEFACHFLDGCYGLHRDTSASRILHYGANAPPDAIVVPAKLFPSGVRTDSDGIHPVRTVLAKLAEAGGGLRPVSAEGAPHALGYDALGLIFLMLSRIEERAHPERDRYNRFSIGSALFASEQGRLHPVADRAAQDLAAALTGKNKPAPRTRYQIKLTHDVDILRGYHRPLEPLRNALGDVVKRGSPRQAARRLHEAYLSGEPWPSFRALMQLSEKHGVQSHFYFMGPSTDRMDSPYVGNMPKLLRALVTEIVERNHVVGFHPGFHTATDAREWVRQREGLEAVTGLPVREGRQHVLRYDAAVTPRIWSNAGMELDCTLSYPESVGFRTGTCRPHQAYDLVARRQLPLKQLSTAVLEFGLFGGKYRDVSFEQAVADSVWAADVCREYGGTCCILFHSGQSDRSLWHWYREIVARCVSH